MTEPLISVIIPVYGVEKYLNQCIESVVKQTYHNLEIILVDDGSKDCCPQICDKWAAQDSRIIVIHKENGGLSDARNAGLRIATGKFVGFVDSDDWIENEMYHHMIKVLLEQDAQIVECGTSYIVGNQIIRKTGVSENRTFERNSGMNELLMEAAFHQTVWNKLYRKDCIGDLEFEFGKYNEDEFWTYQVFHNTKKMIAIPECYYQYRQREGSIMDEFNMKRLDALEARYERLRFIEREYPELALREKVNFVFSCIYFYQKILRNTEVSGNSEGKEKVTAYRKKVGFTQKERKFIDLKKRLYIKFSEYSLEKCSMVRNALRIGID